MDNPLKYFFSFFQDDKPKEIAIYQTVCENMPDPKVLCRLVDLISTRISMSPDPVTVVSRTFLCIDVFIYM
jgi:hypothetical protein